MNEDAIQSIEDLILGIWEDRVRKARKDALQEGYIKGYENGYEDAVYDMNQSDKETF